MVDAHAAFAAAFDFPAGQHGTSWDSFNGWFREFVERHDGERVAVLWDHLAAAAGAAPGTTAEVAWALLDSRFRYLPRLASGCPWSIEMNVFTLGEGDEFDRPNSPNPFQRATSTGDEAAGGGAVRVSSSCRS